jgi:hypothetical protein
MKVLMFLSGGVIQEIECPKHSMFEQGKCDKCSIKQVQACEAHADHLNALQEALNEDTKR